ncbi:MAG: hypothetical protein LRS46_03425 [Desulfurococcales archaeon]|nr:hypothetical protein [Desulfurococcales archaeon]
MLRGVARLLRDIKRVPRYSKDVVAIARRMFVTNAFDGLLAALGVSVGGYSGTGDPMLLAMSIVGGGVSMGLFSGMIGVYLSERAERLRELRELERSMAKSLRGTIYAELAKVIPIYVALWSGLGATMFPVLVALPYFIAHLHLIRIREAFYSSLTIGLALSAILGYYLGLVSGESKVVSVIRLSSLALGGVIAVYIIKKILGLPI